MSHLVKSQWSLLFVFQVNCMMMSTLHMFEA
jgi:hypothetical protein